MRNTFILAILVWSVAACDTAQDEPNENTTNAQQQLVRAIPERGKPQVVLIHWPRFNGKIELCSGVYVAPRVVLTAAHCLRDDLYPNQGYIYHGSDYAADLPQVENFSQPGEATHWTRIENRERHPDWDPALYHPDLGVVYLERALPFAPLPIAPFHLDEGWVGHLGTTVGWGAERALAPDLSLVSGIGVKRTGLTRLLGSPTEMDYHAEDPNPGMLEPQVRERMLKTDGRAPLSNLCAGDSGGPLLVRFWGLEFVAGIANWTGLSCEDYALYTRLDPFFPFLKHAFERAGHLPLRSELACITENDAGQFTAYFGYENENAVTLNVPHGWFNAFPEDHDQERPVDFKPGKHPWAFRVPFSAGEPLTWWLAAPHGPFTYLRVDTNSPRCDWSQTHGILEACEASAQVDCGESFLDCTDRSWNELEFLRITGFPCTAEFDAIERCISGLAPSAIECVGSQAGPGVGQCEAESMGYLSCLGI